MNPRVIDMLALVTATSGSILGLIAWRRARRIQVDGPQASEAIATVSGPASWRRLFSPVAERLRPTSQADLDVLVTRLLRAGRRSRDEADRFLEEKVASLLMGALPGLGFLFLTDGSTGFLLFLACLLLGLLAPEKLLDARGTERREQIAVQLPAAVDLLVTCLDAGLSIEQTISRVGQDLSHASPLLAEELRLTASELEAGVSLPDALRRMGRRIGLDELSALCGVIAQAHSLGAPIAQTLRDHAISSRRQRMSILEERAGKLSTQLTIPLAVCLLPAALIMILGPAAIQLMQALK
ncbi:MAG: type II secretion system F family protein [Deltaproteobacteria bacterium]|nr:type II secretion system F family protein [Deltaproteobacteria bacterium]